MTVKLRTAEPEPRKPVAMIREGRLYLSYREGHGYLDTRTGYIVHNGTVSADNLFGGTPVYPGDTVTITFDGEN